MKLDTPQRQPRARAAFVSVLRSVDNLSIGKRLVLLSLLAAAVIVLLMAGGHHGMRSGTQQLSTVYKAHAEPMGAFGTALDQLHRSRMRIVLAMETSYARQSQEHFEQVVKIEAQAAETLAPAFAALAHE